MKYLYIGLILLNLSILKCQTWQWAFSTKGLGTVQTVIGADSNIYVAGSFKGDSCLINGNYIFGQQNLNLLLAKLSPLGNIIWTRVCSSTLIKNVGILEYNNEIIFAANFSGNMTGFITDSSSSQKYFLAKVNSTGNLVYYKKEGNANLISIDLTNNGSILANGTYNNSTLISGVTLTGLPNVSSGFFLRYNNSGSLSLIKNLVWKNNGYLNGMHSDPSGNIYMSAAFEQDSLKISNDTVVDFTSDNYQYARELFRFDSNGKLKQLDITSVYFTNMIDYRAHGNADYTIRLISTSCNHCVSGLIIKRVDGGNQTWWHLHGLGSPSGGPNGPQPPYMYPGALTSDYDNIYFAGTYQATQLMGDDTLKNSGMVVAKMDHAGTYEKILSAQYGLTPTNLSNVKNKTVILSGLNSYGGFIGTHQLDSLGTKGGFIAKLSEVSPVLVKENLGFRNTLKVYPNPSNDCFVIETEGSDNILSFKVYNILGEVIISKNINASAKFQVNLNNHPKGLYLLEVIRGKDKLYKNIVLN
ncbi:MAG: hypothetical protein JWO32_2157 [Bacteroidetes bacterium]|nr:hypothetical protein [Bacteroidota bacterium]